jgi:hypothetical protein
MDRSLEQSNVSEEYDAPVIMIEEYYLYMEDGGSRNF